MKNFAIITNRFKDEKNILANKIADYIMSKGGVCSIHNIVDETSQKFREINVNEVSENLECVITIGGDGTLLHAAKDLESRDVSFIGVNKGMLGFLAEISHDELKESIERLLSDDFNVESRMMLNGEIIRNGKIIYSENVLNDIIIHRGEDMAVITFDVYVNGQLLGKYTADGLILATPTGSTAYNLSAGGPLARPDSHMIIMTPICPHSIGNRSIIFSEEDVMEVHIGPAKQPNKECRKVCFDGDSVEDIVTGDVIRIQSAKEQTKIIKLNESSFLQAIKDKLGD